jgi:glycosyltransferase involved in cell wall biosynthesis
MSLRRQPCVGVTNWLPVDDNQYLQRLVSALKHTGVRVAPIRLAPVAVVAGFVRGVRVVHVHWPEYLVRPFTASRTEAMLNAVRVFRFAAGLAACRALRIRVVWTVHNLGPHEADASRGALLAYALIARAADIFVVHSHAAAVRTRARFPRARRRVVVVPHGHYLGAHPPAVAGRSEVRARYGVPSDAFLLLAFGQIRRYKRLAELTRAVDGGGGASVHLLVAGAAFDDAVAEQLQAASEGADRVHVDLRRIPADQVSELHGACDAAVCNHAELFSSGALLLALSQGLPVITAESDAARDVAAWPAVSTFRDSNELLDSVERLRTVDPATRRAAAVAAATEASWERAAVTLRGVYTATADASDSPRSSRNSPSLARRSE